MLLFFRRDILEDQGLYMSRIPMRMAGATGLEPAVSCVTGRRFYQLNYAPFENRFLVITASSSGYPPLEMS
jgi:hypothetical protein